MILPLCFVLLFSPLLLARRSLRIRRASTAWWILAAFLTFIGICLGVYFTFGFEYSPRPDFRYNGFPFPINVLHLEGGRWIDYDSNFLVVIPLNCLLFCIAMLMPLAIVVLFHFGPWPAPPQRMQGLPINDTSPPQLPLIMPPMDCTLKIIAGPEAGHEFHCNGDQTVIGRSPRCTIRLSSPNISVEHALISRTGDDFFVENLSANGTFLNNERLASRTRLHAKDQLRLGPDTVARVESLPASSSSAGSSSRRLLLLAVVAMLAVLLAVVVMDPFSGTSSNDWPHAYTALQQFTQDESAQGRLPADIPGLFREAWRLESAADRTDAGKAWLRLRVLLDNADEKANTHPTAGESRRALDKLLHPDPKSPPLSPDDLHAALIAFVRQMESRK